MLFMNKLGSAPLAMAVFTTIALTGSAFAEIANQNAAQVAEQLAEFKRTAFEMRREASTLKSFTANKRLGWLSHTDRLDAIKSQVNEMGRSLAELEACKPLANEQQALAIEQVRPHLVLVAQNLTKAIELVNENRDNVNWGEYGDVVSDIYAQSSMLHHKLDTILDYEGVKMRLDNLELSPSSTEGS